MVLIKCNKCGKEISDKADKCPNCGCPATHSYYHTNTTKEVNKNSKLSIISLIFSLLLCTSLIGFIIAIVDLCTARKNKQKHILSIISIIIFSITFIVGFLFMCFLSTDNAENTTTQEQITSQVQETTEASQKDEKIEFSTEEITTEIANTFEDKVIELLGNDAGNNLIKILKDELGFTELSSIDKVGKTLNYKIKANGYELMVTKISDTDFRIIIPNSDHVFYENGAVTMTFDDFNNKQIDKDDMSTYYIMAQEIVTSTLTNPSSADFPSIVFHPEEISMKKNGDLIAVKSYVEAKNSFGAKVRSEWTVQFTVIDMKTFSCQATYVSIDGKSTGEFIDMD